MIDDIFILLVFLGGFCFLLCIGCVISDSWLVYRRWKERYVRPMRIGVDCWRQDW